VVDPLYIPAELTEERSGEGQTHSLRISPTGLPIKKG
jgi:hypothetical protein